MEIFILCLVVCRRVKKRNVKIPIVVYLHSCQSQTIFQNSAVMTLSVITAVSRTAFCGGAGLLDWLTLAGSSGLAPAQCPHFSLRRGFEPKSQSLAFLRVDLAEFLSLPLL